jgi:two-component system chemotaxis sensor kinase CheA
LSRDDIFQFIFRPGFSTAKEVTAISGRGVGMDVVLTNLRKLNGKVKIDSQLGIGTRIRLELPLTLAVVEALLVGVGENTYAIPVEAVRETVKVNRRSIKRMMKKKALTLRGEVVGMETLGSLLGMPPDGGGTTEDEDIPVLILQKGGEVLGVAVDKLYRQEEVVIKPLVDYLASLPGLAGASILGDGRPLLILDPAELIAMAMQRLEN